MTAIAIAVAVASISLGACDSRIPVQPSEIVGLSSPLTRQGLDSDLDWCRRHAPELQQLGKLLKIDYSALNSLAMNRVPANGSQQEREVVYWAAMEANATYRSLCGQATLRRRGDERWTAPPVPAETPPGGGNP